MLPEDIATYGENVDQLFWLVFWMTLVVFVLVEVVLVILLVRYRHREGWTATFSHGSRALEISGAVAAAAVIVFFGFYQRDAWSRARETIPPPESSLLVRVFAEQFGWFFVYAGKDGRFAPNDYKRIDVPDHPIGLYDPENSAGEVDDVVSRTLIVPVDTDVVLELNALPKYTKIDEEKEQYRSPVFHSFFAPHLRLKGDVVPFHPGQVWFNATRTGTYEIVCAELCGEGHYKMRADLRVVSDPEMEQFLGDWKKSRPFGFPVDNPVP